MKYTDKMIAELRSHEKMNYAGAVCFASLHNLPIKSVVAKINALGIPYIKKDAKTWGKPENPEPTKADYIQEINVKVGKELPSLNRLTLPDLVVIARCLP